MQKRFENQGKMLELYDYVNNNPKGLIYGEFPDGNILVFQADSWYQGDNDLEPNDPNFEEYEIGVFKITKAIHSKDSYYHPGSLFEINYHTFPAKILYDYKK